MTTHTLLIDEQPVHFELRAMPNTISRGWYVCPACGGEQDGWFGAIVHVLYIHRGTSAEYAYARASAGPVTASRGAVTA